MTQLTATTLRRAAAAFAARLPFVGAARRLPRPGRRTALVVVIAIVLLQGLMGTPAMAQSALNCTAAPDVERPGAGFVGKIDPPIGNGLPGTAYLDYSYAGLVWHTYDTPCLGGDATVTTWIGNRLFDVAKLISAATSATYYMQESSGQGGLGAIDEAVVKVSKVFYQGVFTPWLMVVAAIAGVGMLFLALSGNLARIGKRAFWVLSGLTFASAMFLTPTVYTGIFDGILGQGVRELRSNILTQTGDASPEQGTLHVLPTLVHDQLVWRPWLEGEFGSADSPKAKEFGRALLDSQAWSTAEVAQHKDGDQAVLDAKQRTYKDIGGKLKGTDAYPAFKGEAVRIGAGLGAVIQALALALFQLLNNLVLFLAMLLPRLIVAGSAMIGLAAMASDKALPRVGKAVGTSVWIGIQLSFVSLLHLVLMRYITDLDNGLSFAAQLTLVVIVSALLWAAVRPFRKLHTMITTTAQLAGVQTMPWDQMKQYRQLRRLTRHGRRGTRATERVADSTAETAEDIADFVHNSRRHRPEAGGDTTVRAYATRIYDRDGLGHRTRGGSLPSGSGPAEPPRSTRGHGSPGGHPGGGAGTTFRTETDGSSAYGTPEPSRTHDTDPDSGPRASGPPSSVTPEVIIPSRLRDDDIADKWRETEASGGSGPEQASPATFTEDGKKIYRVYRPSSDRIEDDTEDRGGRSGRPETEER